MTDLKISFPSSGSRDCFTTRLGLLWMNLSNEPLIALYSFMPFLLRKEVHATTFEIALFTTLCPIVSVLSFYWSAWIIQRQSWLLFNLVGAWALARIPFLFFPYLNSFWPLFGCCALYQLFSRASTPALMEILKKNLPKKTREYSFSFYYMLSVLEGIIVGLFFSQILNISHQNWKILFLVCALISLTSICIQLRIKISGKAELSKPKPISFIKPIKESFHLLKTRPDFALFQWSYMIGGFALMLMAPARSIFVADELPISLSDMTIARFVFVGLGMAGSSLLWRKGLEKYGIQRITNWILFGFSLFPITLLLSLVHVNYFYFAHLLYGIVQGGSHLVWHLSGTIFAGEESSIPYTAVNVLMIGVRGIIGPLLGGILCYYLGSTSVLIIGALVASLGSIWGLIWKFRLGVKNRKGQNTP